MKPLLSIFGHSHTPPSIRLPYPVFSNHRIENGIKIADVKWETVAVAEKDVVRATRCCHFMREREQRQTLSERDMELWSDSISRLPSEQRDSEYFRKVSDALFFAQLSLKGIGYPARAITPEMPQGTSPA